MSPIDLIRIAIQEANSALTLDEVPIGCVIYHVPTERIIGRGHNRRMIDADPTAHAEMIAMRQAAQVLQDWRLEQTILAVTLEPCPMCAGAIVNARIPHVVYGCDDPKAGAVRSLFTLCSDSRLNHRAQVTPGVMADQCARLLTDFFATKRAMGKK